MQTRDEMKARILEAATQITIAAIEKGLVHGVLGKSIESGYTGEFIVDPIVFFETAYNKMAELAEIEELKSQTKATSRPMGM